MRMNYRLYGKVKQNVEQKRKPKKNTYIYLYKVQNQATLIPGVGSQHSWDWEGNEGEFKDTSNVVSQAKY